MVCADGTTVRVRRAVLATCPVPDLFGRLIEESDVPAGVGRALDRFEWDLPTVKVNWAVDHRVPWRAGRGAQDRDGASGV